MTSTVSINNKSKKINFNTPFWANFRMNLKSLKKILIVMCVLHILGLPLLIISEIASQIYDDYAMFGFIPLSTCCLVGALFCGFIIALNSFDYLYKKSKVDMIYSLPLTTKQQFLSNYFSGLCAYTIPYIISVILTLIIHGLSCFAFKEWAEYNSDYSVTTAILKIALGGLFIMIMFYTLTVLVTSCCGSLFECVAYNIFINGIIPGVIAVFFLVFFDDLYGINVEEYLLKYISNTSPIGACIGIEENFNIDIAQLIKWYILTLIADVVYFFIAYMLYSKRKAEDVSKPFVFKAFYYITMTAVTFIIIALMVSSNDVDSIVPMIFLSAIVYFICEVITNRGFKKFGWSILRYVGTVCGVIVICLILKGTKGFGIENKVPNPSSVKSVTIDYSGIYQYGGNNVTFKDKQSIEDIINFHKDAVENRFNSYIPNNYYDDYGYEYPESDYTADYDVTKSSYSSYTPNYHDYYNRITITYNTKLGSKISREYNVSFEQYMMLKDLSIKKEYIESCAEDFKNDLLIHYLNLNDYYPSSYYNHTNNIPVENRKYYIEETSKIQVNYKEYNELSYSQILQLADCYKKDLENRTLDDILTPNDTYCYLNDYIIFSSYENTIKFLTENDLKPPSLQTELQSYHSYGYNSYGDCILYSPNDITCVGGDYYTSIDAYKTTGGKYLLVNNTILPLLEVAQPNYVTTDECYILSFNGRMFVIPKEHTQIAEEFYKGLDSNDYFIQSVAEDLNLNYEYDYLDCYLDVHDIWKKHFTKSYSYYEDFVEQLLLGNVDIFTGSNEYTGNLSASEFNTLNNYSDYYWNIYYYSDLQQYWNDWGGMQTSLNYDDFVWYILKYTFNCADDSILFDDNTVTSKEDTATDDENKKEDTTTQENPKIEDKPIDENLSNV